MRRSNDKEQKELEKCEGAPGSQMLSKELPEETALTQHASNSAGSQLQRTSVMITPATPLHRGTSRSPPSTSSSSSSSSSEGTLTADTPGFTVDTPVFMMSPHRRYKASSFPSGPLCSIFFSKDMLIRMNHKQHHLEIDLLRPEREAEKIPPQDLSPLCLYRELRRLKITGMMESYQSYLWLVVWLNPQLTDLTLEMAGKAEPLDIVAIVETRKYAECNPTMREVAQGKARTEVPEKLQIVSLSLTNFVMHDAPFEWFSNTKLQKVELHRCEDGGFQLPIIMERSFTLTLTV